MKLQIGDEVRALSRIITPGCIIEEGNIGVFLEKRFELDSKTYNVFHFYAPIKTNGLLYGREMHQAVLLEDVKYDLEFIGRAEKMIEDRRMNGEVVYVIDSRESGHIASHVVWCNEYVVSFHRGTKAHYIRSCNPNNLIWLRKTSLTELKQIYKNKHQNDCAVESIKVGEAKDGVVDVKVKMRANVEKIEVSVTLQSDNLFSAQKPETSVNLEEIVKTTKKFDF